MHAISQFYPQCVAMQKTCQQVDMSVQKIHSSSIHFMENGPSILSNMPWIELQKSEVTCGLVATLII